MFKKSFTLATFLLFSLFVSLPVSLAGTNVIQEPTAEVDIEINVDPGVHTIFMWSDSFFKPPKKKGVESFRYGGLTEDSSDPWSKISPEGYLESQKGVVRVSNRTGKPILLKGTASYPLNAFRNGHPLSVRIDYEKWWATNLFAKDFDLDSLRRETGGEVLRLEHIIFPSRLGKPLELTVGEIRKKILYRGKSNESFVWRKGLKFHGLLLGNKEGMISGKLVKEGSRKILLNAGAPVIAVLTQKNEY